MTSEINNVVSFFYDRFKRENSFTLLARIRQYCVGISKDKIQSFINRNCKHCLCNPIFSNKENLKPVIATKPMERYQIDLVFDLKKILQKMSMAMFISTSLVASTFLRNTYFYKEWNLKVPLKLPLYWRRFSWHLVAQVSCNGTEILNFKV